MHQPSLFDSPAERPQPKVVNVARIRKHLLGLLRTMRLAVVMPWHDADAENHEETFPLYAGLLPAVEAATLIAEFEREMARLKAINR